MNEAARSVARELQDDSEALAKAMVARQYELQPDVWESHGEEGRRRAIRDCEHHLGYLAEAISENDVSVFTDYTAWLNGLFLHLKFPEDTLRTLLRVTGEVLGRDLSTESAPVAKQYVDVALAALRDQVPADEPSLEGAGQFQSLAKRYMDALLNGSRNEAAEMIEDALEHGVDPQDLYLKVFQPAQREIGRLWHRNLISVAQEHYCSAATQLIMSSMYPRVFSSARVGKKMIATCVGGELHEIGVRMVADFFEMEGWDTYYLGANTPISGVLQAMSQHRPNVLGLSVTMSLNRSVLRDLITAVRESEEAQGVKILVGGSALLRSPELWRSIGADGFGADALGAVEAAKKLTEGL